MFLPPESINIFSSEDLNKRGADGLMLLKLNSNTNENRLHTASGCQSSTQTGVTLEGLPLPHVSAML